MPRTAVVKTQAPGAYGGALTALTMAAADVANLNSVEITGKELIVIHNTDAAPHNVTITSVASAIGRLGHITNAAIPANSYAVWGPTQLEGWRQADGKLYFQADHAGIKFGVIVLP